MTELSPHQREIVSTSYDRLSAIVPVVSLVTGAAVAAAYVAMQAWQLLGIAILALFNAMMFFVAGRLARQGLEQAGGALMVVMVWVLFGSGALLVSDVAPALGVIAAAASAMLTALVIVPHARLWYWLGSIGVGVALWVSGTLSLPWARFDVATSPVTWLGMRLLVGSVMIVLIAQIIRAYRRTTPIPVRLTVLAAALVLATAAGVSGISTLMGAINARQRVYAHLETDVALKQEAISAWGDHLRRILDTLAVLDGDAGRFGGVFPVGEGAQIDPEAAELSRGALSLALQSAQVFREIALADTNGVVVVSTDPVREGSPVEIASDVGIGRPSIAPAAYDAVFGEGAILVARPLTRDGTALGVLLGWADLTALQRIALSGAGEVPVATYLVGPDFALLTEPLRPEGAPAAHSEAINAVVASRTTPSATRAAYTNHEGVAVLGAYAWSSDLQIGVVSEVPAAEVAAGGRAVMPVMIALATMAALIAGVMAFGAAQDVVQPLSLLSDSALSIAGGDLEQLVEVPCHDEVGMLADSFNVMSAQVQDTLDDLDRRLAVRTRALAAVVEASEAATMLLEPDELLQRVADLTRGHFDLAYVGIFVLDTERRYAVLRAGTGEVGGTMLASGWRLLVGGASMIGQCVATGEVLVVQRPTDTTVRLENPLLPDVRSEAAIPIRYGARILGAMTAQSLQRVAFSDVDLSALQALAGQVAWTLQAVAPADGGLPVPQPAQVDDGTVAPYVDRVADVTGYDQRGTVVEPLGRILLPEVAAGLGRREPIVEGDTLRIPLVHGDDVAGLLGVERPGGWCPEAIALVTALAEELQRAAVARSHPGTARRASEPGTPDS